MQHLEYLILIFSALFLNCSGQVDKLAIDPKINKNISTKICTDFQYHHCIDSCNATLSFDTLKLVFLKETASTYDELTIFVVNNKAFTKYKTVYMVLDPGIIDWYPIKQDITLNTKKWSVEDQIYGILDVKFQEIYTDPLGKKNKTKVIGFSGQFSTQIK